MEITSEDVPLPDICSEVQLPIARLGKVLDNLFQNTNVCHSRFPKPTASSVMTSGHSLPAQLPSSNEMPREVWSLVTGSFSIFLNEFGTTSSIL